MFFFLPECGNLVCKPRVWMVMMMMMNVGCVVNNQDTYLLEELSVDQ